VDEGAGNGYAAAHSTGKAGGIEGEGVVELDEAQSFMDAGVDFVVRDSFGDQLVADIVTDGEGVEERALLEDHAGCACAWKELSLGHVGDFLAEELNAALVGPEQTVDQLEQDALSHARGSEQDARLFLGATEKLTSSRTGLSSKAMETFAETRRRGGRPEREPCPCWTRPNRAGRKLGGSLIAGKEGKQHPGDKEVDEDDAD